MTAVKPVEESVSIVADDRCRHRAGPGRRHHARAMRARGRGVTGGRVLMSERPPGVSGPSDVSPPNHWSTWREAVDVALTPRHLRATVAVAAVVGTLLLLINQLDAVLQGRIGMVLLVKALLTYVVPFLVSNYGLLAATRRRSCRR